MLNQDLTATETLLLTIAEGMSYDSEYDGRMGTYCSFCDSCLDNDGLHDDDCEMHVARKLLGDVWTNKLEAEKELCRKIAAKKAKKQQKQSYDNSHHECKHCHKDVLGSAMKTHVNNELLCLKAQGRCKTGTVCCICCHKTMLSSDMRGHVNSKKCGAKRKFDFTITSVSCVCCHMAIDVNSFEDHYHSKGCLREEV